MIVALIALRRLRTDYLAMVLISLSLVLYDICNNYVPLFNGADGLYNVPEPFAGALPSHDELVHPVLRRRHRGDRPASCGSS